MSASAKADEEGRKLFIGGLAFDATTEDLQKDFGKYGEIEDIQLPMGNEGKHKGFAFLTYRSPEDCQYASKQHNQSQYMGREISAKVVVPRSERMNSGGGGGPMGAKPGDWTCPRCGANVFASKMNCYKCNEPKPRDGGGRGRDDYDDRRYDRRDRDYDRRDRDYDRRDYDRRDRDYDRRDRSYDRGRGRSYDRRDRSYDRGDRRPYRD